jgi:hypothetical protein
MALNRDAQTQRARLASSLYDMSCLGVHFALTEEDVAALRAIDFGRVCAIADPTGAIAHLVQPASE